MNIACLVYRGKLLSLCINPYHTVLCEFVYQARRFGVRSAMPGFIAIKLCPTLVFVDCHFEKYEEAAKQTRIIFADYDVNFEVVSIRYAH